jgi:hypothetical protein
VLNFIGFSVGECLSGVVVFSVNNVIGSFSPQEQRKTSINQYSVNMIKYRSILVFSVTILFRDIRRGGFMANTLILQHFLPFLG